MSGSYDIKSFLDGYFDDNVYFNNPPDYLQGMSDEWFLARYRQMKIVLGTSDWDMCLDANVKMARTDAREGDSALARHLGRQ